MVLADLEKKVHMEFSKYWEIARMPAVYAELYSASKVVASIPCIERGLLKSISFVVIFLFILKLDDKTLLTAKEKECGW